MIKKLYDKLNNPDFIRPGGISYNFYIVPYDVRKEAKIMADLAALAGDLKRPADYIDVLSLNLFDVFMEFLGGMAFGKKSLLEHLLEADGKATELRVHDNIAKALSDKAHGKEFVDFVHAKVSAHFAQHDAVHKRPYVFIYGIGAMYPYLRANAFLTAYEAVNDANRYKVILFYPGIVRDAEFSLFGVLNDHHAYRAQILEL